MKQVTLTRDMRPWRAGDTPVIPDALAAKLIAGGEAKDERPFPPQDVAPRTPVGTVPDAIRPRGRYLTRQRRV